MKRREREPRHVVRNQTDSGWITRLTYMRLRSRAEKATRRSGALRVDGDVVLDRQQRLALGGAELHVADDAVGLAEPSQADEPPRGFRRGATSPT